MTSLRCTLCDKTLANVNSLRKHKSRSHPDKPREKYSCFYCDYKTVYKFNLNKHMNKVHFDQNGVLIEKKVSSQPLKVCSLCSTFECNDRSKMIEHYTEVHDIPISERTLSFSSFEEFSRWKLDTESQECCRFVATSSQRKRLEKHVWYFRCFRDGHYMPRGTGKRSLKVKGSVKMGSVCPCSMKVTRTIDTGGVSVLYVTPHVGHKPDVSRLTLTKEERDYIASSISAGTPDDELLTTLHDSMSTGELSRLHLTTRKDLWNIKNAARIQKKAEADERTKYENMKQALITNFTDLMETTKNCAQLEVIRKALSTLPEAIKSLETSLPPIRNPNTLNAKRQIIETTKITDRPVTAAEKNLTGCTLSDIVRQALCAQDDLDNGGNEFQILYS